MLERDSPSRSHSVPLGHKFLAVLFAAAVAFGAHTWLTRDAGHSASAAELSFDPKTARHIDPGIGDAAQPAIAAAQTILSDQVVAGLSKGAYLASSGMTTRIGEFRSRLEFTQPSARVLDVRFHDADPTKSLDTANVVANALAAWSPSFSAPAPAPAAAPAPVKVAPVKNVAPPPQPSKAESTGLAADLGQLEDQLSATDRELDSSREAHGGRGAWDLPSYAESRQQQLLKSRVREAEHQMSELRAKYPGEHRLGSVQQELSSILPENVVGVSSARLREERAQLTQTISTVESVRAAIQREEAAQPAPASSAPSSDSASPSEDTQTPAPPIAESNIGQSTATQPQPAPTAAPAPLTAQSEPGPLAVVRLAGSTVPVPWWPSAAAGVAFGLIYFSIVAVRYRRMASAYDDEEVPAQHGTRFITPDAPAAAHEHEGEYARLIPHDAAPQRASFSWEPAPEEHHENPGRRASFSYDPGPHQPPQSDPHPHDEQAQSESAWDHARILSEEHPVSPDPSGPPISSEQHNGSTNGVDKESSSESSGRSISGEQHNGSAHGDQTHVVGAQEAAPLSAAFPDFISDRVADLPSSNEPPASLRGSGLLTDPPVDADRDASERVVPMWDSWADNLKKSLSQTEIGRMFEGTSESEAVSSEQRPVGAQRLTRNRMAG
jgi:hypothetical protein